MYSCLHGHGITLLRCDVYPQDNLKNQIIADFSEGKKWPVGSTFGNYKTIIERSKIASSFTVKWPLVDDEGHTGKNEAILNQAKKSLDEDFLVLVAVVVRRNLIHCHIMHQITDTDVHYWEPGDNSLREVPVTEYLKIMAGDAMSIGIQKK